MRRSPGTGATGHQALRVPHRHPQPERHPTGRRENPFPEWRSHHAQELKLQRRTQTRDEVLGLLGSKEFVEEGSAPALPMSAAALGQCDAHKLVELLDALGQSGDAMVDCEAAKGSNEVQGLGNGGAPPKGPKPTQIRAGRAGLPEAAPAPPQRLGEGKRAMKGLRGRYEK